MTPVRFKFLTPTGVPIANHPFYVSLNKAAVHQLEHGFVHPDVIETITDDGGEATLSLFPANQPYYVTMDVGEDIGECNCTGMRFRLAVPDTDELVWADDLIVTDPIFSQPWDAEAIEIIMQAKAAASASASESKEHADRAGSFASAAANSENAAYAHSVVASTAADTATIKAAEASASANSSADSALAASNSANAAKTSETAASESASQALASATQATSAASAALASQDAAAESNQNAYLNSEAAKQHAENAANASNNAAISNAQAQSSATAAGTSATDAKASEDAAKAWAANPENMLVEGDKYSAYHYAMKARESAAVVAGSLIESGPVDLSTGVYPPVPQYSSIWRVVAGGVVGGPDGDTYGIGDSLVYSKTLGQFYKIDNTESVSSVNGKTGVVQLGPADLGLDQLNNTSDANKPVSGPQQAALNLKADKQFLSDIGLTGELIRPLPSDDFNQAKTAGWWSGASGSAVNAPPGLQFPLVNVVQIGGYVIQDARDLFTGRRAARAYNITSTQWSPWQREAFLVDFGTAAFAALTTSTTDSTVGRVLRVGDVGILGESPRVLNLNTLVKGGSYSYDDRAVGRPAGENYGVVFVQPYSTVNITQTAKSVGENSVRMFTRVSNDGGTTWGNWNRVVISNEFGIGGDARWIGGANLNALNLPPGRYFMSAPAGGPAGITFYGFLDLNALGDTESQKLTYVSGTTLRTFERFKPDTASGWRPWTETTPFGVGQVWRNVTDSRAIGVTYRNTTGRPIQIAGLFGQVSTINVSVYVNMTGPDGVSNPVTVRGHYSAAAGLYIEMPETIIPVDCYYTVSIGNGTAPMIEWRELS